MSLIDMNAARRERSAPESLPVAFGDSTFHLPAELPVDVFDPFLTDELGLSGLIEEGIALYKTPGDDGKEREISSVVVDVLFARPSLPLELIRAIYASFEILFGPEQYVTFKAQRPTLLDYAFLFKALYTAYGVSLGEAFASLAPSTSDGETPKQTSASTEESTPETPSESTPVNSTDSSVSDG